MRVRAPEVLALVHRHNRDGEPRALRDPVTSHATPPHQLSFAHPAQTHSPDMVAYIPPRIDVRPLKGDDVVLRRDADRAGHGRVHAQRLADDRLEVRQRVELVHRRVLRRHAPQLLAQPRLHVRRLRERIERPGRPRRRRFVPGDEEPGGVRQSVRG